MKITIIGGGAIGSVIAARFSQKNDCCLYISNRNNEISEFDKNFKVNIEDENKTIKAKLKLITSSIKEAIEFADYIFITYPTFLFKKLAEEMMPFLKNKTLIFMPGATAEFAFKDALKYNCVIAGLQRVHAVARVIVRGKEAREAGKRKLLKVATLPNSKSSHVAGIVEKLFETRTEALPNYINVTLVNSNSILHTTRLYCIFKNYKTGKHYKKLPLFYENWDNKSSKTLIAADAELKRILEKASANGIDTSGIIPLLKHYESHDAKSLTKKINSIVSFRGIETPSTRDDNGFLPDFSSRYFVADFNYGLDVILQFAKILNIKCKKLSKISNWYHKITNSSAKFYLNDYNIASAKDLLGLYKI